MDLEKLEKEILKKDKKDLKDCLIRLLQDAHAGERAAANAYWGHYNSLFLRKAAEVAHIKKIYNEELHHRQRLKEMLHELGAEPRILREIVFWCIGAVIALACQFGGWFLPIYGAAMIESFNIVEYEIAARYAFLSGYEHFVDELLEYAEIERDHEEYLRTLSHTHFLYKYAPKWSLPKPRELIRKDMDVFRGRLIT